MKYLTCEIPDDNAYIIPIGDVHWGDNNFTKASLKKLKGYCDWVMERPNARIFLMGDIFNVAGRNSKTSPFESSTAEYDEATEFFRPYASRIIGAIDGNHESVAKNTDILTLDGWKNVVSVNKEDLVGQFNIANGNIEFHEPLSLVNHFAEELYCIEGNNTKQIVTPNHDVVINGKKIKAKDIDVDTISQKDFILSGECKQKGIDIDDEDIRILTWIIMDGTIIDYSKYNNKSKKVTIQFKLSKELKIERLKSLLNSLDVPFTYKKAIMSGVNKLQPYYIRIYGDEARRLFYLLDKIKQIPSSWRDMNNHQLNIFLEELLNTDGSKCFNHISWTSINKNNVDIIQECCIKNNISFSYSEKTNASGFPNGKLQYHCKIFNNGFVKDSRIKIKKIKYSDEVYCFENKLGTLITRIDGKVAFTGNCRMYDEFGISPMQLFCKSLNIPYCKYSAMIRMKVGKRTDKGAGNRYKQNYFMYAHHTSGGGGTVGGKLNRVTKLRDVVEGCDVLLGAHNHLLATAPQDVFYPSIQGGIKKRRIWYVDCGSFLEWNDGYAEKGMLAPAKLGSPRIRLDGDKHDVHISL